MVREGFPTHLIDSYVSAGDDGIVEAEFYKWLAFGDANPDDWHRFAMEGNWDFHGDEIYLWIVSQTDCDKATALLYFWKAQPEYELEHPEASNAHDREGYALINFIRERWLAGFYVQSELAFSREIDLWPTDVEDFDRRFGVQTYGTLPQSMRISLPGRRLETSDLIEGIPKRFWPEDLWPDEMKAAKP